MRIMQVLLSPRIGGAETLAAQLETEWRIAGVESSIAYLQENFRKRNKISRIRRIRAAFDSYRPTVVVAHSYLPALYSRVAAQALPVFPVLHSGTDDFESPTSRLAERLLLLRTRGVIAVAEMQALRYQARFRRPVPIAVIPNGVGREFTPRLVRRTGPLRIATIARVSTVKRPEFWRATARRFLHAEPSVRFEWWGPLSGITEIDRNVLVDLPGNASYCGPTDDVATVLRDSDILFHPSMREAQGIALLEAAVLGLPVVYADSIAKPDDSPIWKFRYDFQSERSAEATLRKIISEWETISKMAASSAGAIATKYSVEQTAKRYLDFIARETVGTT